MEDENVVKVNIKQNEDGSFDFIEQSCSPKKKALATH